ncbi:nuclear transport factor 2 family protein [Rhodococcus sp. ARC_M6]|uniref:nuclear transport factor 2 family protein n=1 Tax=Rhodococcus sp. ARC_M6 TaxID=2928852 RepID=UPI001FB32338|nr:nuclear transport factor 2 family protein [Rhodococcus sp. ARC_M6]MCJ0903076.1 nuclear transport factor 2 family protein [Rhodococcus sp. ARC_M6]
MSDPYSLAPEVVTSIHQLYGMQSHLIDTGQSDSWAKTFTIDGKFHSPSYPEPVVGFTELTAFAARFFAGASAVGEVHRHVLTNLAIESHEPGVVTVRGYLQIVATVIGGESRLVRMTTITDRVVRVNEEWRIDRRVVSRDDTPRFSTPA